MGDRLLPQTPNHAFDAAKVIFDRNNHTNLTHYFHLLRALTYPFRNCTESKLGRGIPRVVLYDPAASKHPRVTTHRDHRTVSVIHLHIDHQGLIFLLHQLAIITSSPVQFLAFDSNESNQ
jgi:hypothetical protein